MIEKNNIQKIEEYFFTYPLKVTYLRELSRELNLSMPTIVASVDKLTKEGLITTTRGKAITIVKANTTCLLFRQLKRAHNLEQLYSSGLVDFIQKRGNEPS